MDDESIDFFRFVHQFVRDYGRESHLCAEQKADQAERAGKDDEAAFRRRVEVAVRPRQPWSVRLLLVRGWHTSRRMI